MKNLNVNLSSWLKSDSNTISETIVDKLAEY